MDDVEVAGPPFDARGIANLLLEYAEQQGAPLSNLSLQKVLYFAHGLYLTRYGCPLVDGYFEAWENGPVHPLVYSSFKENGSAPIVGSAFRLNLQTRKRERVETPAREDIRHFVREIARTYGRMQPHQLVGWSHRKNAPWHAIVGSGPDQRQHYGLRIENELIRDRFKYHRFAVADNNHNGEISEELPPPAD